MTGQNYNNYVRKHPIYHNCLTSLGLLMLIGDIVLFVTEGINVTSLLLLVIFVYLAISTFLLRTYPKKVQDRVILTEENFRHYVLTGKLLDPKLTVDQVIALRFASDEEFLELCKRAVSEKLSPDDIKKAVENWRGDYYRI